MNLAPREIDKLLVHHVCALAQKRLARGLKLNLPEATGLIAGQLCEFARDGQSVAVIMDLGKRILGRRHVMAGVPELLEDVQVEATFPDGTKLVTEEGDLHMALYGSFINMDAAATHFTSALETTSGDGVGGLGSQLAPTDAFVGAGEYPGMVVTCRARGPIVINEGSGRTAVRISVTNMDDRPIQVGSHYHFIETNRHLVFDRELAYGRRLHIPAGTAVRFEPGETQTVTLVDIGGRRVISGGNSVATGVVNATPQNISAILSRLQADGFGHRKEASAVPRPLQPAVGDSDADGDSGEQASKRRRIDSDAPDATLCRVVVARDRYAAMYGPTTGDRVRLADTCLYVEVERDYTTYGDECKFGGGKVLREGMGQATGVGDDDALDVVMTNALIIDHTGVYKADIGIKKGFIVGIGKAGNPDVMEGVTPGMVVGVTTEAVACEGFIVTAGGVDTHIHFICPQQSSEAIASGVTTMIGGGTGPATGTKATTCTPGAYAIASMLEATDAIPLNFGFTGKGNTSDPRGLEEQVLAGAVGLKLHEDWGTTPAAIDCCLSVAEKYDVQVTIHTDTLNESSNVESTFAAFKGRTIHTYHSEGAGGGHAPDIIRCVGEMSVLPSSTNPTRPYTVNTIDEHLDMLMVCHHLDHTIPADVSFAESRIRGETIAAEDILQDMGAISIVSSDSQAMGRVGEVITRTWQTADKMKRQRGPLREDAGSDADNFRVRRYIAKYTINPAVAHGVGHVIGSVEVGKFADLVLWRPAFFGAKPELIIKGGIIAWSQMGDANASIPTPEPVIMRPMFAAHGRATGMSSLAFVSKASVEMNRLPAHLTKRIVPIANCRNLTKKDMRLNDVTPVMTVDPETYEVTADGVLLRCDPAARVPLGQRYFLM